MSTRAGRYTRNSRGWNLFIPKTLPPSPALRYDPEMVNLLSEANMALGGLREATRDVPHPELFIVMYVKKEALLSSRIEGTRSTLDDLLEFEAGDMSRSSAREVVRHVDAIMYGLQQLRSRQLSLELLKELHEVLLKDVRGADKTPGEFRTGQVRVGNFYPPPPDGLEAHLRNLETFIDDAKSFPPLIQCGIAHVQFETIHPFNDGNGRLGRLLITLILCQRGVLEMPMLYLSHFLLEHRAEYYRRLMGVRDNGDWEGWLKFFFRGVAEVSSSAIATARGIGSLRTDLEEKIAGTHASTANDILALGTFFENPVLTVPRLAEKLKVTYPTANKIIGRFVGLGIVTETTGKARDKHYMFGPYVEMFR
ncbi:MAG: Fic family protein [Candidatus Geothermincolia bacterium]